MQLFEMVTDETLRATNRYGTPEFPFAVYLDDLETCKERRVEWHWHRELEFSAVVSGPVDCLIRAERIRLRPGDGIFLNSGVIHRFEAARGGVLNDVVFAPEFIAPKDSAVCRRYVEPLVKSGLEYAVLDGEREEHRACLEQLGRIYGQGQQSGPLWELRIQTLCMSLWESFFPCICGDLEAQGQPVKKLLQVRLQMMLDFIRRQYMQHIGLEEIAAAANVSKSEALRCFRLGIQTTPVRYLNEYRLSRAEERLLATADKISAVAWKAGFESAGYFCRVFKKQYGVTPAEFRSRELPAGGV